MRIKKAELINVCQHEHIEVEFPTGVTGIFGPSGAGKSNLVNMIQAAWTGDFSVNPGVKNENVRRDMPVGGISAIKTHWEHDGCSLILERGLQPSYNLLVYNDHKYTKVNDITETLQNIVGVSSQVVDEYVFVSQWNIFNFLTADATTRRKSFMRLCGIENAFDFWKILGERQKEDSNLIRHTVENVDEVKSAISERETKIKALAAEIKEMRRSILPQGSIELARKKLLDSRAAKQYQLEIDSETEKLNKTVAQLKSIEADIENKQLEHDQIYPLYKALIAEQVEIEKAKDATYLYESYLSQEAELADLIKAAPAVRTFDQAAFDQFKLEHFRLVHEISRIKDRVKKFDQGVPVACDSCNTVIEPDSDCIIEWRVELEEKSEALKKSEAKFESLKKSLQEYSDYLTAKSLSEDRISRLQKKLANTQKPKKPDVIFSPERLSEVMREIKKLDAEFAKINPTLDRLKKEKVSLENKRQLSLELIQKFQQKKDTVLAISTDEEIEIRDRLDLSERMVIQVAAHNATISQLEEANDQDHIRVNKILRTSARSKLAEKWVESLEAWRAVLHPSNLPEVVLKNLMVSTLEKVNDILSDLGCDFKVSTTTGLNFTVKKPLGYEEPALRLSGGEKVALGVAFRLAVVGHVGMMVLDEPTAGLDSDRLDSFVNLLGNLSEMTRNGDQQIIIITHDNRLDRALDHKIVIDRMV